MPEVKITRVPKQVAYLTAPQADGFKFTASWSNPPENTRQTSDRQADAMTIWWTVTYIHKNGTATKSKTLQMYDTGSATSSTVDLEVSPAFGYNFFYPRGNYRLLKVTIGVNATNVIGDSGGVNKDRMMYDPVAPTIEDAEFDEEEGKVINHVECKEADERHMLYDVEWQSIRYDSANGQTSTVKGHEGDGSGDVDYDVERDISGYQALQNDPKRFFKLTTRARARGSHGNSQWVEKLTYLSLPRRPVIKDVVISQNGYADRVVVTFKSDTTGAKTKDAQKDVLRQHPFTGCRLQVLRNVTETDAQRAYSMSGWEDYDVQDNGLCTALYIPVSEVRPDPDMITWVRVKSWNLSEDVLWAASVPYRLETLEKESQESTGDVVVLAPLKPGRDGSSIIAELYWDKGHADSSNGTQIDWSQDTYAWASSVEPSTYTTTRKDTDVTYPVTYDGESYYAFTRFYIRELEVAKRYYVKARRYKDVDGGTLYGSWSEKRSVVVGNPPDAVTLFAPARLSLNEPLPLSWVSSVDDELAQQTQWQVVYGNAGESSGESDEQQNHILAEGKGGTRVSVPWDSVSAAVDAINGVRGYIAKHPSAETSIDVTVIVGVNGGATTASNTERVVIKNPPSVLLINESDPFNRKVIFTATGQPITFDVNASERLSSLDVVVRSNGATGDLPDGRLLQESGNVLWSGRLTELEYDDVVGDHPFRYHVTLPIMGGVIDRSYCTLDVRGVSSEYEAQSNVDGRVFFVDWEHKAPIPAEVPVVPADYVDGNGNRHRDATIGPFDTDPYNLCPFFSHRLSDATFWRDTLNFRHTAEAVGDGWCRAIRNDRDALPLMCSPKISACPWLAPNKTYTLMLEVMCAYADEATVTLDVISTDASPWAEARQEVVAVTSGEPYARRYVTLGTKGSYRQDGYFGVELRTTAMVDVRLSIYRGEYEDAYNPISDADKALRDTFSVYRVTPDGAYLIASNLAAGDSVTDRYAPYGELGGSYRICTVTEDGDMCWRDVGYELPGSDMRIDFGEDYVELPYDVVMSDSFDKDFEARHHYGESRPEGYWNGSVTRRSSLSTDLIRVVDDERARRVRKLAQHVGPCFVRLPNGCAFEADVQVKDITEQHRSVALAVSLDVTEISPTGAFEVGGE